MCVRLLLLVVFEVWSEIKMENAEINFSNSSDMMPETHDTDSENAMDIHICGTCKGVFADINLFIAHKRQKCGTGPRISFVEAKMPENSEKDVAKPASDGHLTTDELSQNATYAKQMTVLHVLGDDPDDLVTHQAVQSDEIGNSVKGEPQFKVPQVVLPSKTSNSRSRKLDSAKSVKLKKYKCDHNGCKYASAYPKDLTRHLRIHSGEQPFECKICSKRFNRSDKLKLHQRFHTGEKPYCCEKCDYAACDSSSLKKHVRIHTDERPYRCQICPYACRNSSQLVVHLRTHTLDAPYSCKYCQRKFKITTDLKRHERLHTGEKPYLCELCDYRCAIKGNLKMHFSLMHSTENMQKCAQCDFSSPSRKVLRQHVRTHGPKRVSCSHPGCIYVAKSRHAIRVHSLTHQKEKPFKCSHCTYSSKQAGNVGKHAKRYHPDKPLPILDSGVSTQRSSKKKSEQVAVNDVTDCSQEVVSVSPANDKPIPQKTELTIAKSKRKKNKEVLKKPRKLVVPKPFCVQRFKCDLCTSAFVREDSLRSHLRQHQLRDKPPVTTSTDLNNVEIYVPRITTVTLPSGGELVIKAELPNMLKAESDFEEQALQQSRILCIPQIQTDGSTGMENDKGKSGQENITVATLGHGQLFHQGQPNGQVGVVVPTTSVEIPLSSFCAPSFGDAAGQLVYEVQPCFQLLSVNPSESTQYILQSTLDGCTQFVLNQATNLEGQNLDGC